MSIHDHIAGTLKAVNRNQRKLDEISREFRPPDHCCPSCAYSGYGDMVEAQKIRVENLIRLLRKRNFPTDGGIIKRMEALEL